MSSVSVWNFAKLTVTITLPHTEGFEQYYYSIECWRNSSCTVCTADMNDTLYHMA